MGGKKETPSDTDSRVDHLIAEWIKSAKEARKSLRVVVIIFAVGLSAMTVVAIGISLLSVHLPGPSSIESHRDPSVVAVDSGPVQ